MYGRRQTGVTLVEMAIVVAVAGFLALVAAPAFDGMFADQRLKAAARSVADAFFLARAEAIRTGRSHFIVFQQALDATAPIVIVNDGVPTTENCTIDANEVVHSFGAVDGVSWGTTPTRANGTAAPDDSGAAPANVAIGSSFTDATLNPSNPASWVLFRPDGIPRLFTPGAGSTCSAIGPPGRAGGAIYLTNARRDYAVVLSNLGTSRTHVWSPSTGGWKN